MIDGESLPGSQKGFMVSKKTELPMYMRNGTPRRKIRCRRAR